MNTCKSLNIHVGGTVINNFIESPGFVYEDDGFPLCRNLSMEFERTNPLTVLLENLMLLEQLVKWQLNSSSG